VAKHSNVHISEVCSILLRLAENTRKLRDFYVQKFFFNFKTYFEESWDLGEPGANLWKYKI
jgi:hypothetical protein